MSYYTTLYGTYGRLELALKDTSKMNNLYDKTISTLCMGLYYFYHNSALNRAMLHRSYEASIKSDEDTKQKLLMPSRAGGTRWINLAVSIYVRFSIKFLHFVPFHQQIWPPKAILVSDWLLFKKIFSETARQNGAKLGRKHLCKILYKASSFGSIRSTNMATKINSFF
jgi:hypothetical protein